MVFSMPTFIERVTRHCETSQPSSAASVAELSEEMVAASSPAKVTLPAWRTAATMLSSASRLGASMPHFSSAPVSSE